MNHMTALDTPPCIALLKSHLTSSQVILTAGGMSDTTFYFLKEASKKRDFQVRVVLLALSF